MELVVRMYVILDLDILYGMLYVCCLLIVYGCTFVLILVLYIVIAHLLSLCFELLL